MGARSFAEMRGYAIARLRREIGLSVAQAMAAHRLSRLGYVGLTRAALVAMVARGRHPSMPAGPPPTALPLYMFLGSQAYAYQAAGDPRLAVRRAAVGA